jgi:hypothetical protein
MMVYAGQRTKYVAGAEWEPPLYIGRFWPIYWAEDIGAQHRRVFFRKAKLLAFVFATRLKYPGIPIADPDNILKK